MDFPLASLKAFHKEPMVHYENERLDDLNHIMIDVSSLNKLQYSIREYEV
jgi:hypothetical protein